MQLIDMLLIASIFFLTTALLAGALFMRGQWDKIGTRSDTPSRPDSKQG